VFEIFSIHSQTSLVQDPIDGYALKLYIFHLALCIKDENFGAWQKTELSAILGGACGHLVLQDIHAAARS